MAPRTTRAPNLRAGLDRDVYQVLKKLEDTSEEPFKTVAAVYDAIKRSNSSLSRQKKRPLEDSIDRVLQFRKQELSDSEDSEAGIDQPEPSKPTDDRFLLNRQMTKLWHEDAGTTKKRRLDTDTDDNDTIVNGTGTIDTPSAGKSDKSTHKRSKMSSRFNVEELDQAPLLCGLDETFDPLYKNLYSILLLPETYIEPKLQPPSGTVLSGPPGIGKKSLVRMLAAELKVPLISLAGCFDDPERMKKSLTEAIDTAMQMAPCIIFLQNLDLYMSKTASYGPTDPSFRAAMHFIAEMQRLRKGQPKDSPVYAMATTSQITDVNPAVLGNGLFESTLQMRIPDSAARQDIFKALTTEVQLSDDVKLASLANMTHGFVGADIRQVVTLAGQAFADRMMKIRDPDDTRIKMAHRPWEQRQGDAPSFDQKLAEIRATLLPSRTLTLEDFKDAIKGFTPSLRKEGFTVVPDVSWDQVGAMSKARKRLDMSIIGPIVNPELYRAFGLGQPAGVLLWGPPGCGKTLIAQAVANEAQASFILINGPELLNKYVGESERAVRELFQRARSSTPCILLFDEIDSLVPKRDNASTESGARVVNALLTELDGVQDRSGVYVIGTTNRPDMIDLAMLRPGRLSVRLFIDLPTAEERVDILIAIFNRHHAGASEADLQRLRGVALDTRCKDFSGADLSGLHSKAGESSLERYVGKNKTSTDIDDEDWENALATTTRSVLNPTSYRKQAADFGRVE